MTQVLLAEDDPAIAEPLARALGREGYDVRVQGTGQGAIDGAAAADLVVLDLGLPDMDGLDVARAIRNQGLTTPVLVLTARAPPQAHRGRGGPRAAGREAGVGGRLRPAPRR